MSETDKDNVAYNQSTLICRGCLREWGEMKNMYQWGLDADFFKHMDIPSQPTEGLPALLCTSCESDLNKIKNFKLTCQASDRILKLNLENSIGPPITGQVISILENNNVKVKITAPDPDEKIKLICPYEKCSAIFMKKAHLQYHMKNSHHVAVGDIEVRYYCTEDDCIHNIKSSANKFFTGRKHLNQHRNKKHTQKTYLCDACKTKFPTEADYTRHYKTCNLVYFCYLCQKVYTTNETFLVHLMRKHPKLHAKYKQDKKDKRFGIIDCSKLIGFTKRKKAKYDLTVENGIIRHLVGSPTNIIPLSTGVPVISNILQLKPPEIVNLDVSREKDESGNTVVDENKAGSEIASSIISNVIETPKDLAPEQNAIPKLTYDVKPIRVYPAKANTKKKDVGKTINEEKTSDITPEVQPMQINIPENAEIVSAVNGISNLGAIDKLPGQIRVKAISELEQTFVPKELDPIKITRFPPWGDNNVFDAAIEELVDENFNDYAAEEIIFDSTVEVDTINSTDDVTDFLVAENMNIDNVNQDQFKTNESNSVTDISQYYKDNTMNNALLTEENMDIDRLSQNLSVNDENMNIDNITQDPVEVNPKNITNDVSLNNCCAIQTDEMSTQTDTFEGLFSTMSQPSGGDDDYSATVLLADIQTQTSPLEFGISRCNKETQACTSHIMKQTQTYNYGSTSNFISTETQTLDLRSHVHSDVLLSFNSAETQTCMEDSTDGSF